MVINGLLELLYKIKTWQIVVNYEGGREQKSEKFDLFSPQSLLGLINDKNTNYIGGP